MSIISIIIPCYQVESYLSRCLESIIKQTLSMEYYEIILIDDCSTDGTWNVIKQYENLYSNHIIAIQCDTQLPTGSLRELGMNYASGKYLVYIDADDVISNFMLEKLYHSIEVTKSDIVECDFQIFHNFPIEIDSSNSSQYDTFDNISTMQRKYFLKELTNRSSVWGKMISKEFLIQNNIHFCDTVNGDDGYFILLCTLFMKKYTYLSEPLYYYFINPTGIMWSKERFEISVTETVKSQSIFYQKMHENSEYQTLFQTYKSELEYMAIRKIIIDSSSKHYSFYNTFHSSLLQDCFIVLSTLYPSFYDNEYLQNKLDHIGIIDQVIKENPFS